MILALKVGCVSLQAATLWVGGTMFIAEKKHADRLAGALIAVAALASAIVIARAK